MAQTNQLSSIQVRKIYHRDQHRIGLFFKYNLQLIERVKIIPRVRYSATLKCWHLPNDEDSIAALNKIKAHLSYYEKSEKKNKKVVLHEFDPETLMELKSFQNYLEQRRYASNTIQSYIQVLKVFTNWLYQNKIDQLNISVVEKFNKAYFFEGGYSRSYQNIFINALKLYLRKIDFKEINIDAIERPKHSNYLPSVLSNQEIKDLISSYSNLKHKSIVYTIYACGLRKSELLDLQLKDIDSHRMVIRIRNSKGAKDRDVALPKSLLHLLRTYVRNYNPKVYLFNGQGKIQYSARSIDKILQSGLRKCGIYKKITTHSLRHSYATHLVEKNINLRYIQDALGHKSSKTTEIYTKLSKENIAKMVSPVDFWEDI